MTEERVSFLNFITRNNTHIMRFKTDLTLLIVSTFWGSAFVAQRVAGQMGSIYLFNGSRYLFAAVVVLPFTLRADRISNSRDQVADRGNLIYQWEQYQWMLIAGFVLLLGGAFQQLGVGMHRGRKCRIYYKPICSSGTHCVIYHLAREGTLDIHRCSFAFAIPGVESTG